MDIKFKVIIEDGNPEAGITRHTIDCEHLAEAIEEYRKALDAHIGKSNAVVQYFYNAVLQ